MSTDEATQNGGQTEVADVPKPPTEPAAMASGNKKRPRIDLTSPTDGNRERKRGKSMFGILVGTLNKAKIEDKERNASEAAKKRQMLEQRLQLKLQKETDSVRRAEEAKKEKTTANRKEEELQLKDSVYKLRRTRLSLLANFLLTSDIIPPSDSTPTPSSNPLAPVPRIHPPPLYYLPTTLLPEQDAFIKLRKTEVEEAVEKEWQLFRNERQSGVNEIQQLRQRVAEEESRRKSDRGPEKDEMDTDLVPLPSTNEEQPAQPPATLEPSSQDADMDVDDAKLKNENKETSTEQEKKEEPTPMQADDDDAVEY